MFLLRHGRAWRGGAAWTLTHERWLLAQRFEEPALAATYAHYRAVLDARDAPLEAIAADLAGWYDRAPFADAVARLAACRGITRLGALTLASEAGDWRRFPRAAAFAGLWPGAPGVFQRHHHPAGPHHQGWQCPPARPAGLGRPGPTSTGPRSGSTCAAASRAWIPR